MRASTDLHAVVLLAVSQRTRLFRRRFNSFSILCIARYASVNLVKTSGAAASILQHRYQGQDGEDRDWLELTRHGISSKHCQGYDRRPERTAMCVTLVAETEKSHPSSSERAALSGENGPPMRQI